MFVRRENSAQPLSARPTPVRCKSPGKGAASRTRATFDASPFDTGEESFRPSAPRCSVQASSLRLVEFRELHVPAGERRGIVESCDGVDGAEELFLRSRPV